MFLLQIVCLSCGSRDSNGSSSDSAAVSGEYAAENVLAHEPAYSWKREQDAWIITRELQDEFSVNQPWSLYVYYLWKGAEEDLPLELTIGETEAYNFFPKTIPDSQHGFKETFLVFHSEQRENLPAGIIIKAKHNGDFSVTDVKLEQREANSKPLAADPGTMMHYPLSSFRRGSYETFSHNLYPNILYLVSDSFTVQSMFLKRLAFFTEKPGFTGRLAEDREIANLRDWFAHDYRAGDMASFFDLARKQNFPLNGSEIVLRNMLLAHGIIRDKGGAFTEGKGALLGFSVESRDRLFVYYVHESVHGLQFTIPELQTVFTNFFDSLSPSEKTFLQDAFVYRGYNVLKDRELLASETAAYLLQQSPEETGAYFRDYILNWYLAYHKNPKSGYSGEPYSDSVTEFLSANPGIFGRRSAALQKQFHELTGLNAKNFYDLLPKDGNL